MKPIQSNHCHPFRDVYTKKTCAYQLSQALYSTLLPKRSQYDIILICIGTDRSTGDALGPLVGSKLMAYQLPNMNIYGTLDQPVHALNLEETYNEITNQYPHPFIIAVDACLGRQAHIGTISFADGPLQPGTGVKKKLPAVGHCHITGVVNVSGFMEFFILQNTRLATVMHMAECISTSMAMCAHRLQRMETSEPNMPAPMANLNRPLTNIRARTSLSPHS